jgi:hypothetical protein
MVHEHAVIGREPGLDPRLADVVGDRFPAGRFQLRVVPDRLLAYRDLVGDVPLAAVRPEKASAWRG